MIKNLFALGVSLLGAFLSHAIWLNTSLDNSFFVAYMCGGIMMCIVQLIGINTKQDKEI